MGNEKRITIGLVVGDNHSEYLHELVRGFEYCAKEEDVNLILLKEAKVPQYCKYVLSEEFDDIHNYHFHGIHNYMSFMKPDVIILAYGSMTSFAYVKSQQEYWEDYKGIPCLLIEDISTNPEIPYLISDNYGGMYSIVEHLVKDHHYKNIAFMAGPKINFDSNERLQAYYDVMFQNDLHVDGNMIAYGDFTDQVEEQITKLLQLNPDLEAIVCANDNMAEAAYIVCDKFGMTVGSDIAITGYDDSDMSSKLNPALTTVNHSGIYYAYCAISAARKLYAGEKVVSNKIPTVLCKRESCGCSKFMLHNQESCVDKQNYREFVETHIDIIIEKIFEQAPYKKLKQDYRNYLVEFFEYVYENVYMNQDMILSQEVLMKSFRKIYALSFLSTQMVGSLLNDLLEELINLTKEELQREKLLFFLNASKSYLYSKDVMDMQQLSSKRERQTWYLASFTRDLLTSALSFQENMKCIMERMRAMGVTSTYFLFFEEEVFYRKFENFQYPDKIYLSSYYKGDEMVTYPLGEGIPVDKSQGFVSFIPENERHQYTVFLLFAGERHYGVMLCDAPDEDYDFLLECSLQLGSLFHGMELQELEEKAQAELRSTMKQIEEQNRILSFVSNRDELTHLLNRRGFMEGAIQMLAENQGKNAILFFADLDHLKEINDCFGHMAGDFAICKGADYLLENMPEGAIVARIGGDEYMALVIVDETLTNQQLVSLDIIRNIRVHMNDFNKNSDKDYMIELSIGAYEFLCDENVDIEKIISSSDSIMYREKQKRRASVKK